MVKTPPAYALFLQEPKTLKKQYQDSQKLSNDRWMAPYLRPGLRQSLAPYLRPAQNLLQRRDRPATAPLAIGGSRQSDFAKAREHILVLCLHFASAELLTEMLDVLWHRFHRLRLQAIEAPFHKGPSHFSNVRFHTGFKLMSISGAHARMQKRASCLRQRLAKFHHFFPASR